MRLSILTTITNPEQRQDKAIEALNCYCDIADEVIIVNGGDEVSVSKLISESETQGKVFKVDLNWPNEWNWIEFPRHLNEGLKYCTGDWIIRLDIDQFIHEKDFQRLRNALESCPKDYQVATMQKMSFTYENKYYQKGGQEIIMRNLPNIAYGENSEKETDLCFPIHQYGTKPIYEGDKIIYELPWGKSLKSFKTGITYFNYDYYFKTKEFTKKEFWRASRAYHRFYKNWNFGSTEDLAFNKFINMLEGRHKKAPYMAILEDHPKSIRDVIKNLTKEQFGYSGWK